VYNAIVHLHPAPIFAGTNSSYPGIEPFVQSRRLDRYAADAKVGEKGAGTTPNIRPQVRTVALYRTNGYISVLCFSSLL